MTPVDMGGVRGRTDAVGGAGAVAVATAVAVAVAVPTAVDVAVALGVAVAVGTAVVVGSGVAVDPVGRGCGSGGGGVTVCGVHAASSAGVSIAALNTERTTSLIGERPW